MKYKEYIPSPFLRQVVETYWSFESGYNKELIYPVQHETLPYSALSIVLIHTPHFSGVRLLGPHISKFKQPIFPNSIYFGIRLLPWINLEGLPDKQKLLNTTADAPSSVADYFINIVINEFTVDDNFLPLIEDRIKQLISSVNVSEQEIVKHICIQLNSGKTIAEVTAALPFSIRVIQKKFKETTGLTMKQYAGNVRQMQVWKQLLEEGSNRSGLIYQEGFFDEAHFINDFKKKMGRTPKDFAQYMRNIDINLSN